MPVTAEGSVQTVHVHPRARDYPGSFLDGVIPQEAELTCGTRIEPGKSYGFFTDTTLCIGCKACEVACKEWNALPADQIGFTGMSYDNTGGLSANTWRHVAFIEKRGPTGTRQTDQAAFQSGWLMMSDVCKHCHNAPCLEACPTGALFKTDVAMQHTQESQESRISIALQHALDGALKKQQSEQPLPLLLVATVESLDSLSGRVRSACFYRELESKAPDQELRAEILEA
ncbi:MAG: 4Fe-4S dicluster domain-containing protein, partial [Rhodospirillales bacterium]|nr:4Fe-4S dicluster domain-containing protein [Rhodospirillales bacterium]